MFFRGEYSTIGFLRNNMRPAFPFFWRAKGIVTSLGDLPSAEGVLAKTDVTPAVTGNNSSLHPLIVTALAQGKIIGDLRLIATANDIVIGGVQGLFGCADPRNHYLLRRRRFRLHRYRGGTALLLGAANSNNYYHWLLDSLPRWKMLQAAGWRDYDFVLLHSIPRRFQEETLDWLKVPAAKRLRCSKNFVHQFEQLVVPSMPFPVEEVPAWACAWLRSLVGQKVSGPKNIFLSRQGVGGRQLVNEAELQAALEVRGFVPIQLERLSVAEQARFLNSARCVVGPHGAALTNLVFAPPGALLFELFHPQHKNRCYVNLAAACGHRYSSLEGLATHGARDRELTYVVDVPSVLRALPENQ